MSDYQKVQLEIQEREMSLETFQVRIGEAEAKTNDLKASFENLSGMVTLFNFHIRFHSNSSHLT